MTDNTAPENTEEPEVAENEHVAATEEQTEAPTELEVLIAERDALNDKYLRTYAEAENLRRRLDKEKSEAHQYAITGFARDLLGIADAFQQADKAMEADASSLKQGFEMTQKELHRVFEKHGIAQVNPVNEPFNHDYHQAMMKVPATDECPAGHVNTVMQAGFTLNGRLLRPALVSVAE